MSKVQYHRDLLTGGAPGAAAAIDRDLFGKQANVSRAEAELLKELGLQRHGKDAADVQAARVREQRIDDAAADALAVAPFIDCERDDLGQHRRVNAQAAAADHDIVLIHGDYEFTHVAIDVLYASGQQQALTREAVE